MPFVAHVVMSLTAGVLGMLINGYILLVLLWNRKIKSANTLLLLHMATVDIMHCLLMLVYTPLLDMTVQSGENSSSLCTGHGFLWIFFPTVVVWTVCGISCDRYAAISQPLRYATFINTRRALFFLFCTWFLAAISAVPPIGGLCRYTFRDERWACAPKCTRDILQVGYLTFSICVSVLFPVSIVLSCNVHVFFIARYHRHRIASAIYEVTVKAQATVTHQKSPPCYITKYRRGRNTIGSVARNVGTLVIVTVPYFSILLWETIWGVPSNRIAVSISSVLLSCGPSLNAYVYGIKSRFLRQTLRRIFQRHIFKRDASREVQRRLSVLSSKSTNKSSISKNSTTYNKNIFSEKSESFIKNLNIKLGLDRDRV